MRAPLTNASERDVVTMVEQKWGLRLDELAYLPEGAGAYHWVARGVDGELWFVTCDDLDTKPWLGSDRDAVFEGLTAAYRAAIEIRAKGASFVAAPVASVTGAPVERLDDRHGVSCLPFVEGRPGRWGEPMEQSARRQLSLLLARLHRTSTTVPLARRRLAVPGRIGLDRALADIGGAWDGGPLSMSARHALARHAGAIASALEELDRLAASEPTAGAVVTHGEPHPGNVIYISAGLTLVDWDTIALARPERDLWMLSKAEWSIYQHDTGIGLEPELLRAYRLLWALTDVAAFTAQLRDEHVDDADKRMALARLGNIGDGADPAPFGPMWPSIDRAGQ